MRGRDRRLRIALVLPGFAADHSDSCIPVLSRYVAELSVHAEVVVITGGWPFREGSYELHGATIVCTARSGTTRFDRISAWRRAERTILRLAAERPFDLVHAFWATAPGFAAVRTARRLGVPSIVSIAGGELVADREAGYGSLLSPISRRVVHHVIKRAGRLTLGSSYLYRLLPEIYHDKTTVLPLGIDCSRFSPSDTSSKENDPVRLLTVSAMIAVKDLRTIVRALRLVRDGGVNARITAIGWTGDVAEYRRVAALIEELELEDVIDILGTVDHERMPEIYRAHDLLVQASRHEAQGMALLEALASGLPVISTPVGIAPEIVEEPTLSIVEVGNAEGMAAAIVQSLHQRDRKSATKARVIANKFDVVTRTADFLEIYKAVTSTRESAVTRSRHHAAGSSNSFGM